ncbi:hypothetical protein BKA70DRAFT_1293719 [Coprinopsis sp. MPI-PUGE-AT-0042]|nr:hypothetical protein BKA70DRAFT_1293719 [Coprinopsis sp. MPI-PUGE-AT-0042]
MGSSLQLLSAPSRSALRFRRCRTATRVSPATSTVQTPLSTRQGTRRSMASLATGASMPSVNLRLIEKHRYSDDLSPRQAREEGTVPEGDFTRTKKAGKPPVPKHGNSEHPLQSCRTYLLPRSRHHHLR